MSSFVISKVEFVKMAGLMNGIEGAKRDPHYYFMGVCREKFNKAYELNVKSVNEQYHDNALPDGLSYDSIYSQYIDKGRMIYESKFFGEDGLKKVRPKLLQWFSSVMYQIENEECEKEVAAWFYTCIQKLYEDERDSVEGWWGEIEI